MDDPTDDMNEKTSTLYPFTLRVTYKKRRLDGIPVVFRQVEDTKTFWKVNPNVVASEIVEIAKENVQFFPSEQRWEFLSHCQFSRLGQEFAFMCTESYTTHVGKIKNVPLEYTEEQLTEYLREAGVTLARRQTRYMRQEDGTAERGQVRRVILQFRYDRPMPDRVYLGFTSHPVEEYLGPARRCSNCQLYGHLAKNCNGTRRCKICAEDHHHKDCKSLTQTKYANSNGPNAASFSRCPQNKAAAIQHRHDTIYGRKQQRGTSEPNMNTVNPAKPSRPQPPKRQEREREIMGGRQGT
ncbi:hypothetical protein HPB50_025031 [Hyalomma asiaticum]|uniref:Uncharacterized protein n=1 Tax=Hyalomma asiaticum TaxID=266040 RepID=A0ACB7TBG8_HYAAI|nr:hypothetical protein HPB50_025031 [Hyalomma asiaticum]